MDGLAIAAGHEDRHAPLKNYCRGLLLPGERKSIEPMAARLEPGSVQATRQSLHHLVAKAPWSDETLLEHVRKQVLPAMRKQGPVVAWIVDDTGFPKKGKHSVGVANQYCGCLGKNANSQNAVSISLANRAASLPIAFQLYLPESWANDDVKRTVAGVPSSIDFMTKWQIAQFIKNHQVGLIRHLAECVKRHGLVPMRLRVLYSVNQQRDDFLSGQFGRDFVQGQSNITDHVLSYGLVPRVVLSLKNCHKYLSV